MNDEILSCVFIINIFLLFFALVTGTTGFLLTLIIFDIWIFLTNSIYDYYNHSKKTNKDYPEIKQKRHVYITKMDPVLIPISLLIGTIFLLSLTMYRLNRMNSNNYTTAGTVIVGRAMGKTKLMSSQYLGIAQNTVQKGQSVRITTSSHTTAPSSSSQPTKKEADLYY